jgi:hypothetical protein
MRAYMALPIKHMTEKEQKIYHILQKFYRGEIRIDEAADMLKEII